jgi:hypothetical protein
MTEHEMIKDFDLEQIGGGGQEALKDFLIPPLKNPYESAVNPEEMDYPVNYYDNDDGFWDEFITEKKQRYDNMNTITRRRYLKH